MYESSLRYADERDKSYGIAGMTITLVACDGEESLAEIHLDAEPGECMVMSHAFGLKGNPRMSAKIVWHQTLNDLRLSTSMALGNIVCRRYILGGRGLSPSDTAQLRSAVLADAAEYCSLDEDESGRLFDSCLGYVDRIFRQRAVAGVVEAFAEQLTHRRSMTASEAIELLAGLGVR